MSATPNCVFRFLTCHIGIWSVKNHKYLALALQPISRATQATRRRGVGNLPRAIMARASAKHNPSMAK